MSEYSFGYDEMDGEQPDLGETKDQPQGPKWFRDGLSKLSGQVNELQAENKRLKEAQTRSEVESALKAKGYAPAAARLFTGEPAKLDEWLTANSGALAKLPPEGQEQSGEETPAGPPASTVPADGQEQIQRMQEASAQGAAPPQGSDKELAAALSAANSPEDFAKLMQSHGSQFDWSTFNS